MDGSLRPKAHPNHTLVAQEEQTLLLLERKPEMPMEMDEPNIVTTWENRTQIIEIMHSAREMSQEFQDLWNKSGGMGRLSQDDTDKLIELLREIGDLNEMLKRLA